MRKEWFGVLGIWMLAAVPGLGQETLMLPALQAPTPSATAYQAVPSQPAPAPNPAPPPSQNMGAPTGPANTVPPDYVPSAPLTFVPAVPEPYHIWARFEVLGWWVKAAPLPVPIAVTTDGSGNSQTVLGSSTIDYGIFGGGRFVLGAWFDQYNNYGFEAGFFFLERLTRNQYVTADGNGNPALGLSFLSATPGQSGEYIQPLSVPGSATGDVLISSRLELWGAEVNGAVCWLRAGGFEFTTLAGFRYVNLQEDLYISSTTTDLTSGNFTAFNDTFSTRNQFYGGQLGARVNWQGQRLSFDATAKLALGGTHQSINIQGNSFDSTSGSFPGGFYAQPSNSGHFTANEFGIIPTVELKLNYQLTRRWRMFVGYDFMYWNQVVRPGNQIDRNLNLTQSSILGTGTLSGQASPSPLFSRSDFWAQGITFGLEFRF